MAINWKGGGGKPLPIQSGLSDVISYVTVKLLYALLHKKDGLLSALKHIITCFLHIY